ncbi:MAG: hypothetical protein SynsKO_45440 [Synoicihabitans sp.]
MSHSEYAPFVAKSIKQQPIQKLRNATVVTLRPSAPGRKNWLFIGHPEAGQRSAIINSLVISCQRDRHDPLAYLRNVLTRSPQRRADADIKDLLPANWKPTVEVELPPASQS